MSIPDKELRAIIAESPFSMDDKVAKLLKWREAYGDERERLGRIDENERHLEQTDMKRLDYGYAVPYRLINDRIADLKKKLEELK